MGCRPNLLKGRAVAARPFRMEAQMECEVCTLRKLMAEPAPEPEPSGP